MKNLFTEIDQTIRKEKLYADAELKRSTIMQRFKISRHRLNALLAIHTGGLSFPQYINTIRMAETKQLLKASGVDCRFRRCPGRTLCPQSAPSVQGDLWDNAGCVSCADGILCPWQEVICFVDHVSAPRSQ